MLSRVISDAEFDDFVEHHPHGHFLQTRLWAGLKTAHGWRAARGQASAADGTLRSAVSLLLRALPYGIGTLAYAPRGPVADWGNPAHAAAALAATASAARDAGAFAVVIEPGLDDTPAHNALLAAAGYLPAGFHIQPQRSAILSLEGSEDALLKAMKPKTRYNIGLAARKGVLVRAGSAEDAPLWHSLMTQTAARDGFSIHDAGYYADLLRAGALDENSPVRLLIAEFEGQPLAALIATALGDEAIYLYGASGGVKRELMPAYLLQWEAMRWARARGCRRYDLWGIPDEDEQTLEAGFESRHDGLWGVYRFKRGFSGRVIRYTGAHVRVLHPARWRAYQLAARLRKSHGLAA